LLAYHGANTLRFFDRLGAMCVGQIVFLDDDGGVDAGRIQWSEDFGALAGRGTRGGWPSRGC